MSSPEQKMSACWVLLGKVRRLSGLGGRRAGQQAPLGEGLRVANDLLGLCAQTPVKASSTT